MFDRRFPYCPPPHYKGAQSSRPLSRKLWSGFLISALAVCLALPAYATIDAALNTSSFVAGQASELSVDGVISQGGASTSINCAVLMIRFDPAKVTLSGVRSGPNGWGLAASNTSHLSEGWMKAILNNSSGDAGQGQTSNGPIMYFTVTPVDASVNANDCATLQLTGSECDLSDQDYYTTTPSDPCNALMAPIIEPPASPKQGGGIPMGPMDAGTSAGKGDVNGDGVVDILDAVLALRIAVGKDSPSADARARADIYPHDGQDVGDGQITIDDVKTILQVAAGLAFQPGVTPTPSDLRVAATGSDTNGNVKITLYWIGLPGATAYKIYRSETSGGEDYNSPTATVQENAGNHSYSGSQYLWYTDADPTMPDGTEYYYTVRAVAANGSLTGPSEEGDVMTDAYGVPWDTRDPSQIIPRFLIRLHPDEATGPVRIAGPDQTIYDSEFADPLPPEGSYDASTNTYTLSNGESFSLPGDRGPAEGLGPLVAALPPSKGPYRGVRSDNVSGFTGISITLVLPPASEISINAFPPYGDIVDTAYAYIGSGGPAPEVDAGLQYSSLHQNWAAFISVGKPPNRPKLGGFAIGQHRVSASDTTYFHLRYYTAPPPYSNAYLLTAALYNPLIGEFSPQSVGAFDNRNRANAPRMKRVVAIAQKEMGVLHTGSTFGSPNGLGAAISDPYLTRGTQSTFWDDSHAPASLNGTYVGQYNDATISFFGPVYDEHNITISIAEPPL